MIEYLSIEDSVQGYLDVARKLVKRSHITHTLYVRGGGPYRDQIERMAKKIPIRVSGDLEDVPYTYREHVDNMNFMGVGQCIKRRDARFPCVVEAIGVLTASRSLAPLHNRIRIFGRGTVGILTATYLTRNYSCDVSIQGAKDYIDQYADIYINCSKEKEIDYPKDAVVIDVHKIGRLTTAILLSRASMYSHSYVDIIEDDN